MEAHSSDVAANVTGDLDGDGALEVLLLDRRGVHVLWGRLDGGLEPPVRWPLDPVRAFAVADLDGDRAAELVALLDRMSSLRIYAPTGRALPEPAVVFGVAAGADRIAVADVDEDRRPEIVVSDRFTGEFTALRLSPCQGR